jgi:hypothetical protein
MRFGHRATATDRTLEEVGKQFKVTRERIRQIEAKALRKMRHPTRLRQLTGFFDAEQPDNAQNLLKQAQAGQIKPPPPCPLIVHPGCRASRARFLSRGTGWGLIGLLATSLPLRASPSRPTRPSVPFSPAGR